jgi:hypothetical protein
MQIYMYVEMKRGSGLRKCMWLDLSVVVTGMVDGPVNHWWLTTVMIKSLNNIVSSICLSTYQLSPLQGQME